MKNVIDETNTPIEEAIEQPEVQQVGYGKPPVHRRFQKGQSGNPKGRPKKLLETVQESLIKELMGTITVREGGKTIKLSRISAAIRSALLKACSGDHKALVSLASFIKHINLGSFAPHAEANPNRGGVMIVPGIMDIDEWEMRAMKQQEELSRKCAEDHEKTAEANKAIQDAALLKKNTKGEDEK